MAELAVTGPLGEADLGHELRGRPVRAARLRALRRVDERRGAPLERAQAGREAGERRLVEAAADASGEAQGALLVVDAEEEGAEPAAGSAGIGEPADDELLPAGALDLEPGAGAPARVRAAGAFGHQALEPLQAGLLEDGGAAALDVVAVAHHAVQLAAAALEQPLEPALALLERQPAQVVAVLEEQVEGDVRDGLRILLERALQGAEVAHAAFVEHHRLAVQPRAGGRQGGERLRHPREPRRPVQPVAREQVHAAVVHARGDAVAVVLDLVQPVVTVGRRVGQRRQSERDGGGHAGLWRGRPRPRRARPRTCRRRASPAGAASCRR